MRTLIWKEFREHVRWLPLGLIVIAAVCYLAAPGHNSQQQLLATALVTQLAIVTPLLAFALGIVQAYRDLQPAGAAYLNHRSVTSHQIFMAKVLAGFALYATAVVVPLLLLAAWVALQGMQWHPMRPAQVLPALVFALASFALHPAAMLMLARDASWWGTRALPIVPVITALFPLFALLRQGGMSGVAWGILAAALMLAWILWIARQGWQQFASDPPASLHNQSPRRQLLMPAYLVVGTLGVLLAALLIVGGTVEQWTRPTTYEPQPFNVLAVDSAAGTLWMMTLIQEYDQQIGDYTTKTIGGDEIIEGKNVNPLQSEILPKSTRSFVSLKDFSTSFASSQVLGSYGQSDGFFSNLISLSDNRHRYTFDERGYVLRYGVFPQMHWQATIAIDGIYPSGDWSGQPFSGNPLSPMWGVFGAIYAAGYDPPMVDASGVYLINHLGTAVHRLIDRKINALAWISSAEDGLPTLLIRSERQLLEYKLLDSSGSGAWLQEGTRKVSSDRIEDRSLYNLPLTAELVDTINLPAQIISLDNLRVARSPDGWYIAPMSTNTTAFHLTSQGQLETISFRIQPGTSRPRGDDRLRTTTIVLAIFPGVVCITGAAMAMWARLTSPADQSIAEYIAQNPVNGIAFFLSFALVTLLSLWLTRRVAQRRGLSRRQLRIWSWAVLLLGLATPLSVVAIYRRVVREPCPQCQQPRRVDEDRCENCGAQWEPPQAEGIEIIDAHRLPQQTAGISA